MKTIEIENATGPLSEYAREALEHPVVITENGTPMAAVVPIEDVDMESVSLSNNPKFLAILERSRARYREEGGIPLEEIRKRFGIDEES